jgi:16S rRNA (uracil1498-N3)-methyltransferase
MTRRRFFALPTDVADDKSSVRLGSDETRHLRDVLRLKAGDEIYVFDGEGREFRCELTTISKNAAEATVKAQVDPAAAESPLNLILAVGLLKGEKFDFVIQKAVELGVASFIPLTTQRADVRTRTEADAARKVTRWRRVAIEATKQCGRARLMKIENPLALGELITQPATRGEKRVLFAEHGGETFQTFIDQSQNADGVIALVGPEGGWSDEEIVLAQSAGWKIVTFRGRTLRAETAAIAIASLLQHRLGDLI